MIPIRLFAWLGFHLSRRITPYSRRSGICLNNKKENPFEQLALPLAITRFRQAFGRLIRHSGDRGLLIILDKRIMSKHYGKQFIQSLGETAVLYEDTPQMIDHAKKWLSYDKDNDR